MKRTLPFIAPVVDSTQSAMQRDLYDKSIDLYGEEQYVEAFHTLLDHLNPEFRTRYGNAEGTEFHLPHGSIVVNVRLDDRMMYIDADFLNLPAKGRVAMLRQVADMNINRLLLPRFTKEGDRLKMEYSILKCTRNWPQDITRNTHRRTGRRKTMATACSCRMRSAGMEPR